MEKLEAFFGLPPDVKFCKKCVISNQRPNSAVEMKNKGKKKETIQFDDGVCSACHFNENKKETDWKEREEKLFELLEPYRSHDGSYDDLCRAAAGKTAALPRMF